MKRTSLALCAVLFGALVMSNAFAEEETILSANAETTTETTVEATTGDTEEADIVEATTGDTETGAVAEATTGDVAAEITTGDNEPSINDELHAILDKYFEDNAKKFETNQQKKDFFETVKANINKAAETAKDSQKEAFEILKGALETYEIK